MADANQKLEFKDPLPGVPPVESPFFDEHAVARGWQGETLRVANDLHRDGFAVIDFPEPDFDAIADRVVEELAGRYAEQEERGRIPEAWRVSEDVRCLAANARVLDLLADLYGRAAIPFQTLNFCIGTEQGFHSDTVHFSSRPERFMCGVWVAFEDIDEDNGPLVYYPGSHRLPLFGNEAIASLGGTPDEPYINHPRFEHLWQSIVEKHGLTPRTFHAKRGQALIWTANLLHGGAPQRDRARTRHSQVTHYFFDDCVYYCPSLSDAYRGRIFFRAVENIGTGEPVPHKIAGQPVPAEVVQASLEAVARRPE